MWATRHSIEGKDQPSKTRSMSDVTHYVEILWNGDLPSHEPKSPDGYRDRIINRGDFDEGLTGLGMMNGSPLEA
jgi:hypothetical protein